MNLEPVIQSKVSQKEKSKYYMCCAKLLQSCLTLCDPMNYSPPGFSIHGILRTRVLKRFAMASSRGSSQLMWIKPRSLTSPALADRFFTTSANWEAQISY